jgi:hypothetical protein
MRSWLPVLALLAACSDPEPALTSATSLSCPSPGALPFRLVSRGFQSSVNKTVATDDRNSKDQASDTIGNPGGATASVYLADNQAPSAAPVDYHGVKARSPISNGVAAMLLSGENVSLWAYADAGGWMQLGRGKTDDSGAYEFPDTGFIAPNGKPVYAMLEADGSCAEHFEYRFPPGAKVVVTDIDGTLTFDDNELVLQLSDETHVPRMMGAASQLTQAWAAKGYPVVYLTARVHGLRSESRGWLEGQGFAAGPLITANTGGPADVYKTLWMNRMIQSFGWNVVAAYGNADTDITAYFNAGIDTAHVFIVGPSAGSRGTVAIPNNDFSQHIASYVMAQPDNH